MAKCGLKMTAEEVEHIWKGFDMVNVPFSNLVRRFIIPEEFSKLRKIKDEIKQENEIKTQILNENSIKLFNSSRKESCTKRTSAKDKVRSHNSFITSEGANYLIKKAKIAVIHF